MKSVSSVEKAVGLRHDLTELLGLSGMKTRKWCSNEPDVLRDIPVEDRAGKYIWKMEKCPLLKLKEYCGNQKKMYLHSS